MISDILEETCTIINIWALKKTKKLQFFGRCQTDQYLHEFILCKTAMLIITAPCLYDETVAFTYTIVYVTFLLI